MIIVEIDGQRKEITGAGEVHFRDLLANKPFLFENSGIKLISHPLKFEVNGIPVKVEYSNRRKKLAIMIDRDGSVIVKTPFDVDREYMEKVITQNWAWITVNREDVLKRYGTLDNKNLGDQTNGSSEPIPNPTPDSKPDSNPTPTPTSSSSNTPSTGNSSLKTGTNTAGNPVDDNQPMYRWEKNGVSVEVTYRNNLKRLKLTIVSPDAHIQIKAPYGTKASKIRDFIEENWAWYLANRQKALKKEIPMYNYDEGSKIPYLGKEYPIRLMLGQHRPFAVIQFDEIVISCSSKALVPTILSDFYHQKSLNLIKELVPKWSKILGVSEPRVEQKFMVSCWGKCYPGQKKIVLHPQLIFHSKECYEFIVVHELCHFKEPNHSPRFYALLDKHLPNWRALDKEINDKYILK